MHCGHGFDSTWVMQNGRALAIFVKLMKNSSWSLTNNFKSVFCIYNYHSILSAGSAVKILQYSYWLA